MDTAEIIIFGDITNENGNVVSKCCTRKQMYKDVMKGSKCYTRKQINKDVIKERIPPCTIPTCI